MILKGDEMNNMDDNGFDRGKETDALICVTRLTGDDGKIIFDDFDEQVRTWPPTHFRQRIEVMYDGENAKDLGGPRRELLTDLIRYIKGDDSPFLNVINNECWISTSEREHIGYFAAGVAVAMALLFEGPPVNFLAEGQMDRLLNKESLELNGGEREFSRGMNMYGVLELVRKKPVMRYLLRPGTQAVMTMRKLKSLVKPVFSEAGTNSKIKEEKIFRMFNKYLIEVQHGNRPVDIPMILKFITGSETEPITGFDPGLTIEFYDNNDDIPTSSTCTNTFRLPYYDGIKQDSVFAKFDYAFSNKYFGKH
ncbi:unnamed protein product [Owenia fusiformis]|uniref:HECT domain-containing protein n=1 Tax=Owenia fusiformis TaxID=6347 RepID=A0A8S4PWQ5_OWEFU|nr:unnamed protein product [Owenia fusiformis]